MCVCVYTGMYRVCAHCREGCVKVSQRVFHAVRKNELQDDYMFASGAANECKGSVSRPSASTPGPVVTSAQSLTSIQRLADTPE